MVSMLQQFFVVNRVSSVWGRFATGLCYVSGQQMCQLSSALSSFCVNSSCYQRCSSNWFKSTTVYLQKNSEILSACTGAWRMKSPWKMAILPYQMWTVRLKRGLHMFLWNGTISAVVNPAMCPCLVRGVTLHPDGGARVTMQHSKRLVVELSCSVPDRKQLCLSLEVCPFFHLLPDLLLIFKATFNFIN